MHDGSFDIEAGVPVSTLITGEDRIRPATLPGGPAANWRTVIVMPYRPGAARLPGTGPG